MDSLRNGEKDRAQSKFSTALASDANPSCSDGFLAGDRREWRVVRKRTAAMASSPMRFLRARRTYRIVPQKLSS